MKTSRYYHILAISHLCRDLYSPPKALPLCVGDENFMVLNPLKTNVRKDTDVLSSYNYLFEFDHLPLYQQYQLLDLLKDHHILSSVVYSGAKSLHFIIKVNQNLSKSPYQYVWHRLNQELFHNHADTACSHPARLTRNPHAIRHNTSQQQTLLYIAHNQLNIDRYINEWHQKIQPNQQKYLPTKRAPTSIKSFDRYQYLINCAKRKESYYLDFIQKSLPSGSYPLRIKCIAWLQKLTYPNTTTPLYSKNEIYQEFVHGTSKHQKRLHQFIKHM